MHSATVVPGFQKVGYPFPVLVNFPIPLFWLAQQQLSQTSLNKSKEAVGTLEHETGICLPLETRARGDSYAQSLISLYTFWLAFSFFFVECQCEHNWPLFGGGAEGTFAPGPGQAEGAQTI